MYLQFTSLAGHFQIVYTYTSGGINFLKLFFEGFYIVTWHNGNTETGENVFELLFFPNAVLLFKIWVLTQSAYIGLGQS